MLKAKWSKKEKDIMIHYPEKTSAHLLYRLLNDKKLTVTIPLEGDKIIYSTLDNPYIKVLEGKSFIEELEDRGYDITTLKFSVKKKEE